jgi:hypothetical protein
MNNAVIDHHERHQAHIPQEVLCCHNFVKCHKCPSLYDHREENVIVKQKSSYNPNARLRNKHQESCYAA